MFASDPNASRPKGASRGQEVPETNAPRQARGMGHHSSTRAGIPFGFKWQGNVANEPLLCADEIFPGRFVWCWCLMSVQWLTEHRGLFTQEGVQPDDG